VPFAIDIAYPVMLDKSDLADPQGLLRNARQTSSASRRAVQQPVIIERCSWLVHVNWRGLSRAVAEKVRCTLSGAGSRSPVRAR
jgi:hypothetical protein